MQSTVSEDGVSEVGISIRCELSMPESLQNSPLVTRKAAVCNGGSVNAARHCDATSDSPLP